MRPGARIARQFNERTVFVLLAQQFSETVLVLFDPRNAKARDPLVYIGGLGNLRPVMGNARIMCKRIDIPH
jgi:hypothetical protein